MSVWGKLRSSAAYWVFTWYARKREEAEVIERNELIAEDTCDQYEIIAKSFEPYMPAANSGYIRPMRSVDIIEGSSARPGWFGYFDGDGDLVFWAASANEALRMAQHEAFDVYNRH